MKLFLLTYDPKSRKLDIEELTSGDYIAANRRMLQAELATPELEVVVLEAASIDDLKRTHRRYFEDLTGLLQLA